MPVSFTNELYGDEDAKRRARVDARFVNNAMMATLMGAAISDGLENGQVVSGVGGQYNFVAQAFALAGRALDPRGRGDAAGDGASVIQHPLELWPRDHSTASARRHRHRVWHRRYQGKIRRRCDRGDARRCGFPLSGRSDAAGQGRRQAAEELRDSGGAARQPPGADRTRAEAGAGGGTAAVVSVRQRFHRRSNSG